MERGARMSSKLHRLIAIDQLIRAGRHPSVRTIRAQFEIGERTVHEDLERLRQDFGAPIRYSRAHQGYHYTDPTFVLPALLTSEGELLAFFLSLELTRRYLGTAFEGPLRAAIAKIAQHLPNALQVDLAQLAGHFTFEPGAVAIADPLLLTALSNAIGDRTPLRITYFTASRGERNERVIEPYQLHNIRGDWLVTAYDRLREKFRQFAIGRFERWEVLSGERFERQGDFDLSAYLSTGFLSERGDTAQSVAIWFDAHQARYIRERRWHASQQIEEHDDGALTLRFATGALGEVQRWVMSYGSHARVLAPEALVDAVMAEVIQMTKLYTAPA